MIAQFKHTFVPSSGNSPLDGTICLTLKMFDIMCPPPCGHRRSGRNHTPRQYSESYIQKYDVCLIARKEDAIIETRPSRTAGKNYVPFDGKYGDISRELWEDNTKVRIALAGSKDYREGFLTIIMNCPNLGRAFIIRKKK